MASNGQNWMINWVLCKGNWIDVVPSIKFLRWKSINNAMLIHFFISETWSIYAKVLDWFSIELWCFANQIDFPRLRDCCINWGLSRVLASLGILNLNITLTIWHCTTKSSKSLTKKTINTTFVISLSLFDVLSFFLWLVVD